MVAQPATRRPDLPLLVFDGDCGLCTKLSEVADRFVRPRGGSVVASQWIDLEAYGLTQEMCDEALQFVDTDGRVYSAQDAVARLLGRSHAGYRPLGAALRLPGVNQAAGAGYRWVARNRHRLPGGTPACAMPTPPRD